MYLTTTQKLPVSLDEAWEFFSTPENLNKITPPDMNFAITSDFDGRKIYPGMIITYRVAPLLNIRMGWMTEITHVREKEYFVDDQKSGPFSVWHHQHHFRSIKGGVEMIDIVHYKIPLGFLGRIFGWLMIDRRVRKIFEHRKKVLKELFGEYK